MLCCLGHNNFFFCRISDISCWFRNHHYINLSQGLSLFFSHSFFLFVAAVLCGTSRAFIIAIWTACWQDYEKCKQLALSIVGLMVATLSRVWGMVCAEYYLAPKSCIVKAETGKCIIGIALGGVNGWLAFKHITSLSRP